MTSSLLSAALKNGYCDTSIVTTVALYELWLKPNNNVSAKVLLGFNLYGLNLEFGTMLPLIGLYMYQGLYVALYQDCTNGTAKRLSETPTYGGICKLVPYVVRRRARSPSFARFRAAAASATAPFILSLPLSLSLSLLIYSSSVAFPLTLSEG